MGTLPVRDEADLEAWIRRHPIEWQVRPLDEVQGHRVVRAGLRLTLSTTPDGAHCMPGSPEHHVAYRRLMQIARVALPDCGGAVRCEIEGYDGAAHLAPDGTPRVELSIRIVHPPDYLRRLDEDERCVARTIQARLALLQPPPGPRAGQTSEVVPPPPGGAQGLRSARHA